MRRKAIKRHKARTPAVIGFNESAGPASYPLQAEINAPVRRLLVGWNGVQPAAGRWDWSQIDA
jgi:hypothetical protein